MLDVALLGTGGMMPLPNRFLTALLCRLNGRGLLIDCGECTQVTLKLLGWGFKQIDILCVTHFHADHISGLPGLLLTLGNADRTEPFTIIGPPGIRAIVAGLCVVAPELPFALNIIELAPARANKLFLHGYDIGALPLEHGMPCFGYSLSVHRTGKFDLARAEALGLPRQYWSRLQKGESVSYEGTTYTPDMVLGGDRKGIKLSYITDTRPVKTIPDFVRDSDLFICEGLYGEDDKLEKARDHRHMLFSEAAALAKKGGVAELWLTHFSPSLTRPEQFVGSARAIFQNTVTGKDRMTKTLLFSEEE